MKAFHAARFLLAHLLAASPLCCWALSNQQHKSPADDLLGVSSRRNWLWKAPLGAVGTYAYGRLVYNALSVNGLEYPAAHEDRVRSTVAAALTAAAANTSQSSAAAQLRVLEVGIGTDARLIRRNLYDPAIRQLAAAYGNKEGPKTRLELTGVDFRLPSAKVQRDAQAKLQLLGNQEGVDIDFRTIDGSITERLPFESGYFDSIICCLTLCSVDAPEAAVEEIQRLLRPAGGTLGYVEHVAVNENDESHRFLKFQQTLLDPLQQRLADNCHLHRSSEATIAAVMGVESKKTRVLEQERFYVDNMWPVSCQSCGVLQRI